MSGTICKVLNIRIYPSTSQETLILKTLGSCRFIYNHMLAEYIEAYEKLIDDRRSLYEYKYKTEKAYKAEFDWLYELDSIALQQSRIDLSIAHERIANKRKDFTHKLSSSLLRDYDIVVENLNLKAMAQGLHLGKSVNDLGYGAFLQQLQYKALWNNKTVIEADKWFASSKTCSKCGFVYKDLALSN